MKILIFLPTYNEEENIGIMIDTVNRLNLNKEILIVDDNSTDDTIKIINEKLKNVKDLTLIVRTGLRGRGLAGRLALKYFINSDNDIFVELDADFSHHPRYIPEFLKYFPEYDVIIGSRLIDQGIEEGRNKIRRFITFFANFIIRNILGIKIKDCTSGFRAFKKETLKKLNFDNFISINPEIVEELLYGCVLCKARIREIPITYYNRIGGKSKLNFKKLLLVLIGIVKIRLRGKIILR